MGCWQGPGQALTDTMPARCLLLLERMSFLSRSLASSTMRTCVAQQQQEDTFRGRGHGACPATCIQAITWSCNQEVWCMHPHVCLQEGPFKCCCMALGAWKELMLLLTSFMVKYTPSGITSSSLFSSDTTQPSSFMASMAPVAFTTFSVIFLLDNLILRNFSSLGATAQLYSSFPMISSASALLIAARAASAPAHAHAADQRQCS
jgi:hypothetical protein